MLRKFTFIFIMLAVPVAALELFCQFLFYWKYEKPPWRVEIQEKFNFRPFSRLVSDGRSMTMVPEAVVSFGSWGVWTDTNGFRTVADARIAPNNGPAILFLGDSVPFGWGVEAQFSLPGQLERLLTSAGREQPVLNAAIPSYSMHQAIERYLIEIAGRQAVGTIVLWTYDPVAQLALLGNQWEPGINWTTQSPVIAKAHDFQIDERSYSATLAILKKFAARLIEGTAVFERLDPADKPTTQRFQSEIVSRLESFRRIIQERGVGRLVLLPLSAPRSAREAFSPSRKEAVRMFNESLENFADKHGDVHFINAQALLDAYPENEVFLDQCCHLTEKGNALIAAALKKDLLSEP